MTRLMKNRYLHLVLAIVAFTIMYYSPILFSNKNIDVKLFTQKLNNKEQLAEKTLNRIIEKSNPTILFSFSNEYTELNKKEGISFFIVENEKSVFWSDRNVAFLTDLSQFEKESGIVQLKNGWYQYLLKKKNQKSYLALIHIKQASSIKNKYFKNKFHESYELDCSPEISLNQNDRNVFDTNNNFLFSIKNDDHSMHKTANNWLVVILFLCGFLLLISFVSKQTRKISIIRNYSSLIVILMILLFRFLVLYFDFFTKYFDLEFFSPTIYAQSTMLPSLGQLFISTLTFSLIVYYFSKIINKLNANNKIVVIVLAVIWSILPLFVADLIAGLITNSKINFDINYLLDLNAYSFIGIGCITLIIITLILIIKIILNHFFDKAFKRNHLIIIFWIFSLVSVLIGHFFIGLSLFLTGWSLAVILIFSFKTTSKTSFYRSAFLIFVIASTISYGFIHLSKQKEEINKEFIAKKLSKERDPVAEFLFEEIERKMKSDPIINEGIFKYWEEKAVIDKYIVDKYFGGYWKKYDVNVITSCQQLDTILIEPDNINVNCLTFFNDKIEKETDNPFETNKTLNFLYSDDGISSYLSKIKVSTDTNTYYLFIELFPKIFSKTEGYPDLLLDEKNSEEPINTNQYSYAKYKKGKLIDNVGKFNYSIVLNKSFRFNNDGFYKTTFDEAYHVVYQSDKNTAIILSTPQKSIFNYITTFSYFFIITSLLVLLVGLLYRISPFNWQLALSDFSTKIQLFIIVSIFLSFILFGWATTYYIKKQNVEKNRDLLAEKVQSVLIELEHKLGDKKKLDVTMFDEMTYYLIKFSNVFYTDINLYDINGNLLSSSRPEIFDRGLVGEQMDADAYRAMSLLKKSTYTHDENIGEMNFLSTYVPFRNNRNQILAYMNLPYFAKQNELENELSSFYTSLVNVYGLLFLITAIIAVFFANYISEPVRLIKNKIGALQLGKSFELLEWQSNDEIGALVFEYNKKVLELEQSAQLLVQSERESAWREMAKQVAHEIKNPLTPMKLSIQQLERLAKDDNTQDLSERIERTAKTLIEQIDTLTKIANEFSNFAKMPKANAQEINLIPIIETTLDLYHEEEPEMSLIDNCNGLALLMADKDQLSRVFNNLIKNAIQAIPNNVEGKILVEVSSEEGLLLVKISDNGVGISEDKKDKIFVPNFTTKSTGMGLGLAMVKNIVENANGKIWFDTKENVGTIFYLEFTV